MCGFFRRHWHGMQPTLATLSIFFLPLKIHSQHEAKYKGLCLGRLVDNLFTRVSVCPFNCRQARLPNPSYSNEVTRLLAGLGKVPAREKKQPGTANRTFLPVSIKNITTLNNYWFPVLHMFLFSSSSMLLCFIFCYWKYRTAARRNKNIACESY